LVHQTWAGHPPWPSQAATEPISRVFARPAAPMGMIRQLASKIIFLEKTLYNIGYEDNVDERLKRQAMGRELVMVINDGRLVFGMRERVFHGESDGQ
jgi:hypothetical protein